MNKEKDLLERAEVADGLLRELKMLIRAGADCDHTLTELAIAIEQIMILASKYELRKK